MFLNGTDFEVGNRRGRYLGKRPYKSSKTGLGDLIIKTWAERGCSGLKRQRISNEGSVIRGKGRKAEFEISRQNGTRFESLLDGKKVYVHAHLYSNWFNKSGRVLV